MASSPLKWTIITALVSILGAHAFIYVLLIMLPDPALLALGFQSAQETAVTSFHEEIKTRTYGEILLATIAGDLGKTLDGVYVAEELWEGILFSFPRFLIGLLILAILILLTAITISTSESPTLVVLELVSFLPPFLPSFIAVGIGLATYIELGGDQGFFGELLSILAIVAIPAALASLQAGRIIQSQLAQPYARTLLAIGTSRFRQRVILLRNLLVEISPSVEKLVTAMFGSLLFVEPVLGMPGFGSMTVRAVQRSDVNMLLAAILVIGIVVAVARICTVVMRQMCGVTSV